jgi:predicted outer membrane protein
MRRLFAGLVVMVAFSFGVAHAQQPQQPQRENPATQPGAAGQKQGTQAGVTGGQQTLNQPGQVQPTQPGRPGQAGQPANSQNQVGQAGQGGRQTQGGSADQEIAACVYGEAANEIEIAKLAESKAQNEEVRNFAQQMVKDHTSGRDEMKQKAGQLAADNSERRGEQAGHGSRGGQLDWVSIKKEIGQQCLASTKQELSSKQGPDFDKCFMGQQIGAHMKVVDELKVLRNYASPELAQKLDKELQMAQHHLQMAKQIEQKLTGNSSERVSRRPDGDK